MVYSVAVHGARIAAPHVGRFVGKQLAKRAIKQPLKYKNTKAVAGKITGYTKHGLNQAISRNNGLGCHQRQSYIQLSQVRGLYKKIVELLNILVNKL